MSGICAFFGHRDMMPTEDIEQKLISTVHELIAEGIDEFWLCEQGNFDWISRLTMLNLKKKYRYINLCFVCAYRYSKSKMEWIGNNFEIIYPEVAANGMPKFAIERRNRYIAENADVIVCYITHKSGGAYKAVEAARKYGKRIINLADSI